MATSKIKRLVQKAVCFFFLVTAFTGLQAQDASQIYRNTISSTVTIETDIGLGSGFFVGQDIIATNYHVVEGATTAYCYLNNSQNRYKIAGYVAADKSVDLILLKVEGLFRPPLKISSTNVTPGQKIYAMGSPKGLPATISDGIVSGLRDFDGYKLVQITAPISSGSSGGPILNTSGEVVGVAVGQYVDGQNLNFAIPKSNLELLISFKKAYALSISTLEHSEDAEDSEAVTKSKKSFGKDIIYEMGIYKRGNTALSLDYFSNVGDYSVFYFTYAHESDDSPSQSIWMEDYRLVDLETGEVYHAKSTDLPNEDDPRIIYNGTKSRFAVWFDRLPKGVEQFSLMEGECAETSFCFLDIDINDYEEATDFDADLYTDTDEEGTVAFYTYYGNSGDIEISLEGISVGKLTKFFNNKSYSPGCGESGTLTLRLPAGTYNYTAADSKYKWNGKITINANKCTKQGLIDKN
ncbi:MAG: trypsin-like peptidase domain-containing protein [Bacteroidetes bacterium]|nr:trypsin-like peptidase domain-containing protein [Bacteroidota bacterium]